MSKTNMSSMNLISVQAICPACGRKPISFNARASWMPCGVNEASFNCSRRSPFSSSSL